LGTPETGIGSTRLSEKDGMALLYVPAGPFQMGSDKSSKNVYPLHTIYLDAFWIDQTEITNAMYAKCVTDGACLAPKEVNSHNRLNYFTDERYAEYPVLFVPWNEASAYCRWAGRELPTEAQWEKAARGTDGRLYPWGDQAPSKELLNFDTPLGDTKKVGVYPAGASPYGALDMAGNAREWVADWYEEEYYLTSPEKNPTGPQYGYERVIRGGSWGDDMSQIRTFVRRGLSPIEVSNALSFRCALVEE
jgi:serine/threonine-protein kinase